MRSLYILIIIAVSMLTYMPAEAQDDPCVAAVQSFITPASRIGAANLYALLGNEQNRGCVLGPTDTSGIEELYQILFSNASTTAEKAVARSQLLALAIQEFSGRPSSICDPQNVPGCMIGRHVDRIRELEAALMTDTSEPPAEILGFDNWAVRNNGQIAISNINLNAFLTQECATDVTDDQCRDAIALSGSFMRTSIAMNQVIAAFNLPTIAAHQEFLSMRDREWDAYFNDISVQFPWELYFNSRRFSRQNEGELGGFPRAPNDRWIVLHPSVGFEHIDTPIDSSSTSAAVFVEVVGYERWSWRNGSAWNRWGLSGVVSFANIPGMDEVGYGALLHTPLKNISFGAVWRDGDDGSEVGIVANFNIAALIQQYEELDLKSFLGQ